MRKLPKRLASSCACYQQAIDNTHLLFEYKCQQICSNREKINNAIMGRLVTLPSCGPTRMPVKLTAGTPTTGCRLLFTAATCCLVASFLVMPSDFLQTATATAASPTNQTLRATFNKDKNVIKKLTSTSAAAFYGETSQLANKQQQQLPSTRALESSGHQRQQATTIATIISEHEQFGEHKLQHQTFKRPDQLEDAPTGESMPQLFYKYHLNHSRPPPLVPITIQQQQHQQRQLHLAGNGNLPGATSTRASDGAQPVGSSGAKTSKTINLTRPTSMAANNRRAKGGNATDLLMAASELDGQSAWLTSAQQQQQQQLVQLQLPLELHLKLKPLPLPMPPPPSIRLQQQQKQQQVVTSESAGDSKQRRSLTSSDENAPGIGRAHEPAETHTTTATTPTTTTTTGSTHFLFSEPTNRPRIGQSTSAARFGSLADDHLQALTWQEAKRVLLLNSIGSPLVQAAQRRIERRHLLGDGHTPSLQIANYEPQPLGSNHLLADVGVQQVADNSLHSGPHLGTPVKFQQFFPTTSGATSTISPVNTTALVSPQISTQPAYDNQLATQTSRPLASDLGRSQVAASLQDQQENEEKRKMSGKEIITGGWIQQQQQQQSRQGQQHEQTRLSSIHPIELNGELLSATPASAQGKQSHATLTSVELAPPPPQQQQQQQTLSEHESRIQQMAAAMLPFVWPSFQLTTGAYTHLGATKLRARSLASDPHKQDYTQQVVRTTTSSPQMLAPTWPMKYQHLDRTSIGSGSPLAASEFKPTFIDRDEGQVVGATSGTTTGLTSPRPTTTTTTTTTTSTLKPKIIRGEPSGSRQPMQETRSARKRRRKSGYLQQQQERLERQNYQLLLKKKAKRVGGKSELVREEIKAVATTIGPQLASKQEQPVSTPLGDSTRLASRYQMPRIKYINSNNRTTSDSGAQVQRGEQITDYSGQSARLAQDNKLARGQTSKQVTQLPKTLSKLIEQQLAVAASNSNATLRENLLLLQHYFSQKQNQTSLPSKAPTTSVSRIVRVQGAHASGGDLLRIGPAPSGNRSELNVATTTTTTTTTAAPAPAPAQVKVIKLPEYENATSVERQQDKLLELPTSTSSAPAATTTTSTSASTTTTERPTSSTTDLPVSTQRSQVDASLEIGSNRILSDSSDEDAPRASVASGPSVPTGSAQTSVKDAQNSNSQQVVADRAKPKQQQKQQQQQQQSQWQKSNRASAAFSARNNKNIKLFHFKRKPDVAKLPFYKKPLNYTELGWTPEEIEREQRRLAELQQLEPLNSKSKLDAVTGGHDEGDGDDDHEPHDDEDYVQSKQNLTSTSRPQNSLSSGLLMTIGQSGDLSLLKRKRRAKNQFERLMAELQAAAALAASNGTSSSNPNSASELSQTQPVAAAGGGGGGGGGRSSGQPALRDHEREEKEEKVEKEEKEEKEVEEKNNKEALGELVQHEAPHVRKLTEPLVMKPMFFVMNHKRRRTGQVNNQTEVRASELHHSFGKAINSSYNGTLKRESDFLPVSVRQDTTASHSSKPIVRLRRKEDHGELAEVIGPTIVVPAPAPTPNLQLEPMSSPWRPSAPAWSAPVTNQRLLLVPSSLLTPSGSHPMPLFASTPMRDMRPTTSPVINTPDSLPSLAWREQQASAPASQPTVSSTQEMGLPSSDQMTPELPPATQVASLVQRQQQQQQQQSQANANTNSEIRVPKLLVKPMRPAKYSLNGYIPKPSLVNQMQQRHHLTTALPAQSPASNLLQVATGPASQLRPPVTNRDLRPVKQLPKQMVRLNAHHHQQQDQQDQQQQQQQKRQLAAASGRHPATQNKDLDSSTSNEIFSHRRGIHKTRVAQPRSLQSGISFEALLGRTGQQEVASVPQGDVDEPQIGEQHAGQLLPAPRNQMEENRRKYVRQHQQTYNALKSMAPLSAQRANQIRAKLGLPASPNSMRAARPERTSAEEPTSGNPEIGDSAGSSIGRPKLTGAAAAATKRKWSTPAESSASTNSISTLDPADGALELAIAGGGQQLTAGSGAYHTIPKTDFECTNKQGRFVSGLFADFKTGCRVWHLCSNNRKYSFLCPTGTIFNAKVRICDWRYNVKCENEPPARDTTATI